MSPCNRSAKFWHMFFLQMAAHVSTASKDPTTQVGAVIVAVNDRRKFAYGYNGLPRKLADDERLQDRELKRMLTIHAEANAIDNCPFDLLCTPSRLYVTGHPCHRCAVSIIQNGITEVVYLHKEFSPDWKQSFDLSASILQEANIPLIRIDKIE